MKGGGSQTFLTGNPFTSSCNPSSPPPSLAPPTAAGSDELEQQVLEGVQALVGVSGGAVRAQLGSQEEQLPVVGDGAQGQGFVQL